MDGLQRFDSTVHLLRSVLQKEDYSALTGKDWTEIQQLENEAQTAMWQVGFDQLKYLDVVNEKNRPLEEYLDNAEAPAPVSKCAYCSYETVVVHNTPPTCGHVYCVWCIAIKTLVERKLSEQEERADKPLVCLVKEETWKEAMEDDGNNNKNNNNSTITTTTEEDESSTMIRGLLAYVKRRQVIDLVRDLQLAMATQNAHPCDWSESEQSVRLPVVQKCTACMEDFESSKGGLTLTCAHDWCADCLSANMRQAMKSRASWPPKCCGDFTEDEMEQAKGLVNQDLIQKLEDKQEELLSRNPTFCTRPDCGAFIPTYGEDENEDDDQGFPFASCPSCELVVCRLCKHPRAEHKSPGNINSNDSTNSTNSNDSTNKFGCLSRVGKENESLVGEGVMQQCPKCGCLVEKSEGCDHMTCHQCDENFCYRCGSSLAAPFYRCRPECGGGAPAWEDPDWENPNWEGVDVDVDVGNEAELPLGEWRDDPEYEDYGDYEDKGDGDGETSGRPQIWLPEVLDLRGGDILLNTAW